MSRTCPRCKLINPDSTVRCDCGYDFATGEIKASHLQTAVNEKAAARFQELVEKHGSVDAALKAIAKRTMSQGVMALVIGLVGTGISYAVAVGESNQNGSVVFTGAILVGAVQFVRGLTQYLRRC